MDAVWSGKENVYGKCFVSEFVLRFDCTVYNDVSLFVSSSCLCCTTVRGFDF